MRSKANVFYDQQPEILEKKIFSFDKLGFKILETNKVIHRN